MEALWLPRDAAAPSVGSPALTAIAGGRPDMTWIDWQMARLLHGSRPLVVGPWRSEVGFETLYWLPWLAALRTKHKIPKDRLIVVSRGGAGAWYDAGTVVDLYDYVSLEKVRKAMLADSQATGSIKQHAMTEWEVKLLSVLMHDLGDRKSTRLNSSHQL